MATPDEEDPLAVLQYMFDHFSATPGAIIYRGPDVWESLEPTAHGDQLTLEEQPSGLLLPRWKTPS